jgi:tetratricopeptide (TPR) repeat protein
VRVGHTRATLVAAFVACAAFSPDLALANDESRALSAKAAYDIYNLDREEGLAEYRRAVAADPQDAGAFRGLASALWLTITFRRGNMTVDDYLGNVGHSDLKLPPPPPDVAQAFREAVDRAMALARKNVDAHPNDPEAHYQLGAAIGLRASFIVTVEGSVFGGVRAARAAYEEHEKVLELDPKRADAGLIVGTYRYVVSALSMPMRLFAYMAGFGGGKEKGMQMIGAAAAYPGDNQTDARLAIMLLDNREGRYDDALAQLAALREKYPRNRLFWLETGATYLRAGRAAEAERTLSDGLARFATDTRSKMFGEAALWYYKRGAARVALGRTAEADADLRKALASEGRPWVYGRTHLELAKLAIKAGNRPAANTELKQAVDLCSGDNDAAAADEARRMIK